MPGLFTVHDDDVPRGTPLVIVLAGFVDAGGATASALGLLRAQMAARQDPIVTFDADGLVDHRARRPVLHLRDGVNTGVDLPRLIVEAGTLGDAPVLVLHGPEPDYHWSAFAEAVAEMCAGLGVSEVHGLGAYPAPAPHTRPVTVVATSADPACAAAVGVLDGEIDVPASAFGLIELILARRDVPATGLWTQVPHYAAAMPYPAASIALLVALGERLGTPIDTSELDEPAAATARRIDELIEDRPDAAALVSQLERHVDALASGADLPTGDDLAAEIQRFLSDLDDG